MTMSKVMLTDEQYQKLLPLEAKLNTKYFSNYVAPLSSAEKSIAEEVYAELSGSKVSFKNCCGGGGKDNFWRLAVYFYDYREVNDLSVEPLSQKTIKNVSSSAKDAGVTPDKKAGQSKVDQNAKVLQDSEITAEEGEKSPASDQPVPAKKKAGRPKKATQEQN